MTSPLGDMRVLVVLASEIKMLKGLKYELVLIDMYYFDDTP